MKRLNAWLVAKIRTWLRVEADRVHVEQHIEDVVQQRAKLRQADHEDINRELGHIIGHIGELAKGLQHHALAIGKTHYHLNFLCQHADMLKTAHSRYLKTIESEKTKA